MNDEHLGKAVRFGLWFRNTRFGICIRNSKNGVMIIYSLFLAFTQILYWITAWRSPWPYIIFTLAGFLLNKGIFEPWATIISQAKQPEWDSRLLKIGIPFLVLNYVAFFSCLFMLGTVVDDQGHAINGTWPHFYFSAVTITTLGYGNLTPADSFAEFVAVVESIFGFVGIGLLAGVLVYIAQIRANLESQ